MKSEGTVAEVLAGAARFAVVCGDAVEVLRTLPDGCAHVTYCDPSYGLATITTADTIACLTAWLAGKPYEPDGAGFMGHKWDAWVPGPEAWREVHRALRPGGYCVAFSSTRTVDLLGIAVRLAGFEMREGWAWVFGSGFPKSLDVSKAIDARKDWPALARLQEKVRSARTALGISQSEAARRVGIIGPDETLGGGGYMWFETGRVPTREQYEALKSALGLDDECDEAFAAAEREVIGQHRSSAGGQNMRAGIGGEGPALPPGAITAPATEAAAQWSGYGTTTKPCFEPLVVARKPLDGTVAHNVTTHGCGALNIDAARVGVDWSTDPTRRGWQGRHAPNDGMFTSGVAAEHSQPNHAGRFPAALALVHSEGCEMVGTRRVRTGTAVNHNRSADDRTSWFGSRAPQTEDAGHADADGMESCDEWVCELGCGVAELARQSGESVSSRGAPRSGAKGRGWGMSATGAEYADAGSAARFFWQAKAASADRLAFLTCTAGCSRHETIATARDARRLTTCPACGAAVSRHEHSTVKPLDLARYHARLLSLPAHVAPVALVPYCGSGPEARALLEVGFRVIAVDLDPRHCAMTRHRLSQPLTTPQPKRAKRPRPTPDAAPSQPLAAPAAPAVVAEAPTPAAVATKPARGQRVASGQLSLWGAP